MLNKAGWRRERRIELAAVGAALWALTWWAQAAPDPIWITGPSHKVLRTEKPGNQEVLFSAANKTIKLYAARNEFVAFQVVFPGVRQGVNVDKFELTGPGGAVLKHVELFREHYLLHPNCSQWGGNDYVAPCLAMHKKCKELGAPAEFPVQLVPLNAKKFGAPFDVASNRNEVVWADIFVPEDARPGLYTGALKAGGESFKLELTVWNFTLPSVSHFPNWIYVGPEFIAWSWRKNQNALGEMMPIYRAYFQMAHDHRTCLTEGFDYNMGYITAPDRETIKMYTGEMFQGPFAKGYGFELLPTSPDFFGLIKQSNWLNRAFVYLADEPPAGSFPEVANKGKDVSAKTGGKLRRSVSTGYSPVLDPGVDIFISGGNVAEVEKKGKVGWTYNAGHGGAPYTDAPGPAMRFHAWSGFVTGSRAWFFWHGVYTVDKFQRWKNEMRNINKDPPRYLHDVWNDPMNFDEAKKPGYPAKYALRLCGDGLLFYPGQDVGLEGPIACFRLKNLRQGTQDFEYLYLLEKMGKKDAALAEAQKVIKCGMDWAPWDEARIRLGKILDGIGDAALKKAINPYNQYPNPVGCPDWYNGQRY